MSDTNGILKPKIPPHTFVIQTPQGPAKMSVPDEEMSVCTCGHDLFRVALRVGWIKPRGILNAPPMMLRAEVFLCEKCGAEVGPESLTKKAATMQE